MQITSYNNGSTAHILSENILIQSAEDGLNLLGDLYYQGFNSIILHEHNLSPAFFDLKNGMAGEILQKFSNYRVRLAIVGDFKTHTSNSIQRFILESNRTKHINFVSTLEEALEVLTRNKT